MKRTLLDMVANVQRAVSDTIPIQEIHRFLDAANKDVQSSWEWPWLYAEYDVPILAPYSTGTVSIAGATATGTGTAWNSSWVGMRLRVGSSNVDRRVTSIAVSGLSLTLDQAVNVSTTITNQSYVLYQDSFPMPANYHPGHDIFLGHSQLRYRLKHVPRFHAENQMLTLKQFATNTQMFYVDDDYRPLVPGGTTDYRYWIRVIPPPSQAQELRFVYRKNPGDLDALTDVSDIPEPFDEVIELIAQWKLKMQYGIPGGETDQLRALTKLKALKRQISSAPVENQPMSAGAVADSSISQWGMMITPYP